MSARRRQQGFTLIQMVISAGLLGFLALTATFFWVNGFTLVRVVNNDSAAIADAREVLERLAREIREVKYDVNNGIYCVSTMNATQMVFNKNSGTYAPGCGGSSPTSANNDFAVNIQTSGTTNLNLGYIGSLATPALTATLTSYAYAFGIRYLDVNYAELNAADPISTRARAVRFVELSLTVEPPGAQRTATRTVVALRNN